MAIKGKHREEAQKLLQQANRAQREYSLTPAIMAAAEAILHLGEVAEDICDRLEDGVALNATIGGYDYDPNKSPSGALRDEPGDQAQSPGAQDRYPYNVGG